MRHWKRDRHGHEQEELIDVEAKAMPALEAMKREEEAGGGGGGAPIPPAQGPEVEITDQFNLPKHPRNQGWL